MWLHSIVLTACSVLVVVLLLASSFRFVALSVRIGTNPFCSLGRPIEPNVCSGWHSSALPGSHLPPGNAQSAGGEDWRVGDSQPASPTLDYDTLPLGDLRQDGLALQQWLLDSHDEGSPDGHGSSSESLDSRPETLPCSNAGGGNGALQCSAMAAQSAACSCGSPACDAVVPQQQQHEAARHRHCCLCGGSPEPEQQKPPAGAGAGTGAPLDWQALLEDWAVPASAAVPPLDMLLAESDEPPPLQPLVSCSVPQPTLPPLQPPAGSGATSPASASLQPAAAAAACTLTPRRSRSQRSRRPKPGGMPATAAAILHANDTPSQPATPALPVSSGPVSVAAPASLAVSMPAIPIPISGPLQPPPPLSQPQSDGRRKRGRPRVYDTLTPVLKAAASLELQSDEAPPDAPPDVPPPKKKRGARPKYICATQEEAIARRRDRNRQTALNTYYRRKARLAELQQQVAGLEAEHMALAQLTDVAEESEECARYVAPLLQAGHAPAAILQQLLPDEPPWVPPRK